MVRSSQRHLFLLAGLFTTAFLITCFGCTDRPQQVLLRLKPEPGKQNTYQTIFQGDFSRWRVDSLIQKRRVKYEINSRETFPPSESDTIVKSLMADSGSYRVTNLLDSTSSDSSWQSDPVLSTMSPRGKLINLESMAKGEQMDLSYNRALTEQTFPVFPEDPVTVGRSWTQTTKVIQNGSPLEASITFSVKSFEKIHQRPVAVIDYDGVAIIPFPPRKGDSTFISAYNQLKVTGTIWYDYERGGFARQTEHRLLTGQRLATERPGDTTRYRIEGTYDLDSRLTGSVAAPAATPQNPR